ncbi:MAG: hypothetical protein ACE5E0_00715 [Terriglobia bacterium]
MKKSKWMLFSVYSLTALALIASVWISQAWVIGAASLRQSGAINIIKLLERDFDVAPSDVYGFAGSSKKDKNAVNLFFSSASMSPDFGTVNYSHGVPETRSKTENKQSRTSQSAKKGVIEKSGKGWSVVWTTTESAPPCCEESGAVHVVDKRSAEAILGQFGPNDPPAKTASDLAVIWGLASANDLGIRFVSKTAPPKNSPLYALEAPARFAHLPFIALTPRGLAVLAANLGSAVIVVFLGFIGVVLFARTLSAGPQGNRKRKEPSHDNALVTDS